MPSICEPFFFNYFVITRYGNVQKMNDETSQLLNDRPARHGVSKQCSDPH
jgi:hypothetical protein